MRCFQSPCKDALQPHGALLILFILLFGCTKTDRKASLFELLPPSQTGIEFQNKVEESMDLNIVTFEMLYNGAGVAAGDINNDGLTDLFFASNMGKSRIYINEGDFKFSDITETSGINTEEKWASGVTMMDINADGFLDLYISFGGPYADPSRRANELYINNGNQTFSEQAEQYGIADTGFTTQAVFFDYNKNGLLDLYLLTNGQGDVPPNVIRPKQVRGEHLNTDRLYKNNGDGTFSNVSEEAGILLEGYGLGVNVFDINRDGLPDIHAANDFLPNDAVYVNNGDGTFTDRASEYFRHQSYSSMGTDFGDINNDGLMDIIVVDMLPEDDERVKRMYQTTGYERFVSEIQMGYSPQVKRNVLQLNTGSLPDGTPVFSEIGLLAGVASTDWSWSALFADFDNDGLQDLAITNGLPRNPADSDFSEYKMNLLRRSGFNRQTRETLFREMQNLEGSYETNYIFRNNGDLTFSDTSDDWGFRQPSFSTGAVYVDLDNDGRLDFVTNNTQEAAFVYRNVSDQTNKNYLSIKLNGPDQNRQGIGSHVIVYAEGETYYHEYAVSRGYLSAMVTPVHFGLGEKTRVDSVVVIWPDDVKQTVRDLAANQKIEISWQEEGNPKQEWKQENHSDSNKSRIFHDVTAEKKATFSHQEKDFSDFKVQPLLPHKFSKSGPGIAVGDANGDGLEDFFIGGAFQQPGELFLQNPDGTFESKILETGDHYEKDMGALFLDINRDGHQDLYIASGGSEFRAGSEYYQDRVYFGDGNGNFTRQTDILPEMRSSTSIVAAADFDQDGSKELFVGSRVVPNQYPLTPESYILKYQDGRFVNITEKVAPGLKNIGLVSSAIWTDFNNDFHSDLIIVGEWMPITVFENRNGMLENVTEDLGLSETVGWWNSIVAADFDQDGYMDYAAGNLGLNSTLQNRENGSVQIHYGDFNRDGLTDPVISQMLNGVRKPVHLKDDLLMQMPVLESRFTSYEHYGKAALTDLLSSDHLSSNQTYSSDTFQTSLILNRKGASMEVKSLPLEAQIAPVFGLLAGDYDGDGFPDILMTGNFYSTEMFTGRYDAFNGLLLKGNGEGEFDPSLFPETGFYVSGDAKALTELAGPQNQRLFLSARNNSELLMFESRNENDSRVFYAGENEISAEINYEDGRMEKKEFYDGGGYLSQKTRSLLIYGRDQVKNITFYDNRGNSRIVIPE
ncbi:VCBS repeat-containing protein [Rhodohalobacter sp. 614A]|uniref:VCBS repeat-containing protein n=1 Tax=Rhodohalobacter sp. 614A TaxID=2908649 RepID=UPI001F1F8046|nr:VCBS repeat-containing protein [Rhodohalobacter sp. 614A]